MSLIGIFFSRCRKEGDPLNPLRSSFLLKSLPNDTILDSTKLKALADDKINASQMLRFVSDLVEKHCEKREKYGYRHFLLYQQCFRKVSYSGS